MLFYYSIKQQKVSLIWIILQMSHDLAFLLHTEYAKMYCIANLGCMYYVQQFALHSIKIIIKKRGRKRMHRITRFDTAKCLGQERKTIRLVSSSQWPLDLLGYGYMSALQRVQWPWPLDTSSTDRKSTRLNSSHSSPSRMPSSA